MVALTYFQTISPSTDPICNVHLKKLFYANFNGIYYSEGYAQNICCTPHVNIIVRTKTTANVFSVQNDECCPSRIKYIAHTTDIAQNLSSDNNTDSSNVDARITKRIPDVLYHAELEWCKHRVRDGKRHCFKG